MMALLWILLSGSPLAQAAENWTQLMDERGGNQVHFGAEIEASPAYAHNASNEFAPASNAKYFTFGAALETLGPDFTFPTQLQWNSPAPMVASHMQLIGYGDPSWGLGELGETIQTRVTQIAKSVAATGVRQIEGDLQVVEGDARWTVFTYPTGWQNSDKISCDGALPQAFNLSINCSPFEITSPTAGHWTEAGLTEAVSLSLRSGKTTKISVALLAPDHPEQGFRVSGTLKNKGSATVTLPVFKVKDWIHNLLVTALKKQGVTFVASTSKATGAARQLTFESPALKLIGKAMMKNSINLVAEALFKYLGLAATSGEETMFLYLSRRGLGGKVILHDGSGLSRQDQVSPEDLLTFLNYIKGSAVFPAVWDALPIAGVDGTLKSRMKGTAAAGHLRAKTGTLNGVYNLSGFVPLKSGYASFVMLSQSTVKLSSTVRAAEDRVGAELSKELKPLLDQELEDLVNDPNTLPYIPAHAGQDAQ